MRRLVLGGLLFVFASAQVVSAAVAGGGQQAELRPVLRLLERQPLVVRGHHFKAGERVTVVLASRREDSLQVTANGEGSFTVSFGDVEIGRCEAFRVSARGSRGSRAALKLPQPLCLPVSAPLRGTG